MDQTDWCWVSWWENLTNQIDVACVCENEILGNERVHEELSDVEDLERVWVGDIEYTSIFDLDVQRLEMKTRIIKIKWMLMWEILALKVKNVHVLEEVDVYICCLPCCGSSQWQLCRCQGRNMKLRKEIRGKCLASSCVCVVHDDQNLQDPDVDGLSLIIDELFLDVDPATWPPTSFDNIFVQRMAHGSHQKFVREPGNNSTDERAPSSRAPCTGEGTANSYRTPKVAR